MTTKHYYRANIVLTEFLESIDGSYEQFARQAGCSARTLARLRGGGRVDRKTVNGVMKSAQALGLTASKEECFELIKEDGQNG